ncbi:uncharacterized protein LOC115883418 [Sitophilus oryzae]|uniref:Uncharacterized protein LOC115883418 n=1 Tax=Sitophilus oryzae TaxID=7048 RepID=A0A6J2Y1Q1_SITOR|nr:uncharacterized protein LOC115883418 [Sitophilus oryzae]
MDLRCYKNSCRLCLKPLLTQVKNIFTNSIEGYTDSLIDIIFSLFGVQLNDERKYPQYICRKCLTEVENMLLFKEDFLRNQNILYNLFCNSDSRSQEVQDDDIIIIEDTEDFQPSILTELHERTSTELQERPVPEQEYIKVPKIFLKQISPKVRLKRLENQVQFTNILETKKTYLNKTIYAPRKQVFSQICTICDKTFRYKLQLQVHYKKKHKHVKENDKCLRNSGVEDNDVIEIKENGIENCESDHKSFRTKVLSPNHATTPGTSLPYNQTTFLKNLNLVTHEKAQIIKTKLSQKVLKRRLKKYWVKKQLSCTKINSRIVNKRSQPKANLKQNTIKRSLTFLNRYGYRKSENDIKKPSSISSDEKLKSIKRSPSLEANCKLLGEQSETDSTKNVCDILKIEIAPLENLQTSKNIDNDCVVKNKNLPLSPGECKLHLKRYGQDTLQLRTKNKLETHLNVGSCDLHKFGKTNDFEQFLQHNIKNPDICSKKHGGSFELPKKNHIEMSLDNHTNINNPKTNQSEETFYISNSNIINPDHCKDSNDNFGLFVKKPIEQNAEYHTSKNNPKRGNAAIELFPKYSIKSTDFNKKSSYDTFKLPIRNHLEGSLKRNASPKHKSHICQSGKETTNQFSEKNFDVYKRISKGTFELPERNCKVKNQESLMNKDSPKSKSAGNIINVSVENEKKNSNDADCELRSGTFRSPERNGNNITGWKIRWHDSNRIKIVKNTNLPLSSREYNHQFKKYRPDTLELLSKDMLNFNTGTNLLNSLERATGSKHKSITDQSEKETTHQFSEKHFDIYKRISNGTFELQKRNCKINNQESQMNKDLESKSASNIINKDNELQNSAFEFPKRIGDNLIGWKVRWHDNNRLINVKNKNLQRLSHKYKHQFEKYGQGTLELLSKNMLEKNVKRGRGRPRKKIDFENV